MRLPCSVTPLPPQLAECRILHLGAGRKYRPDAVNVDVVSATGPDLLYDLDVRPWPLPDGHFREVLAYDVIEHLDDVVRTMEEIHRVSEDGAVVKITVPHFSCANAFTDITHRHYFSAASFNYFTGDNEFDFYTDRRFQKRTATIVFQCTAANKVVHWLANRYPDAYERTWAWMFPAWFLYFELVVVKGRQ
ncbi:MAG: methyltransferase domain-containing protein [Planctomycetaceae bacterium]|nr:methyltransferase domain-containing protein [Planctomycetaceae bacterium]